MPPVFLIVVTDVQLTDQILQFGIYFFKVHFYSLQECSQVDSLHAEASFMYGFKLASWIMIEVMTGKGELVRNED